MRKSLSTKVRSYYSLIDAGKIDELLPLFDEKIRWQRSTNRVFEGIAAIGNFFKVERKLTGAHEVGSVQVEGDRVLVRGRFHGFKGEEKLDFPFTDEFHFSSGKINFRKTEILDLRAEEL